MVPEKMKAGMRGKKESGGVKERRNGRQWRVSLLMVAGSAALYAALRLVPGGQGILSEDGKILREGYGGENREYQVFVKGLEEEAVPLIVPVGARIYTREEAQKAFSRIMENIAEQIRGDNPSLMEVRSDLALPSQIQEAGVRLRWSVSDPEYMDTSGRICREAGQSRELILSVQLSAEVTEEETGRYYENYEIPIRLLPPEQTVQEKRREALIDQLHMQDEEQQAQEWLELPSVFDGHALSYEVKEQNGYEAILLLGILAAVLWWAKEQTGDRERQKKREKELLLDYADVLSKLIVLIGAGLTIRNAWERIVHDYEAAKAQGRQKVRAAYEEMSETCGQMQRGVSEGKAYRDFGRRCRLRPYLKLSSLLEQNRKAGTKNLRAMLQTEMADALEQRKSLARRLGEEAGTRLLMPLFLMLGIIMVMIMVPAMMTMG